MEQLLLDLENLGCDVQGCLRRFGNNEKMYLKYLRRFPDEETYVKFLKALSQPDYENAFIEIHTLKGVTGTLGFSALYELSKEIMHLLKEQDYDKVAACTEELVLQHKKIVDAIGT